MHSGHDEAGRLNGDDVLPVIEERPDKNPYGLNRKARRALKAENRKAARRIRSLVKRLSWCQSGRG